MHTDMAAAHAVGALYRFTGDAGLSKPMAEGLLTQNGLAWSPEGDRMYLSDSHPKARVVWAYDYDRDSGTPSNRGDYGDIHQFAGRPHDAAVDVDSRYRACAKDSSTLLACTPEGS